MVVVMSRIAPTASLVAAWIWAICAADLVGGPAGLVGQALDLVGDHGEALAGIAGARRLDGGVQRQQVGLAGDVVDQVDHVADLLGGLGQRAAPWHRCAWRRPPPCR